MRWRPNLSPKDKAELLSIQKARSKADRDVDNLPRRCETARCCNRGEKAVLYGAPYEYVVYCDECLEERNSGKIVEVRPL